MSRTPKVALVTGASSGIGEAIALRLLDDGWTVYGAARRTDRLAAVADAGGHALALDVTDDAAMAATVATVVAAEGRIDALVNNAGYGSYGAVEDVPLDEARRQFEVNVFGLARMCQLVLPHMRAAGSGHIVNISSMGGRIFTPMGGWYHATKHAVEGLSDALRLEVAPFGIRVVVVQPGAIASEWADIAGDRLAETSADGPYAELARQFQAVLDRAYADAASPAVVADAVHTALRSSNPRPRYAVPADAKINITARRLLPDRVFDRLVTATLTRAGRGARTP